jgi:hypothetical protein
MRQDSNIPAHKLFNTKEIAFKNQRCHLISVEGLACSKPWRICRLAMGDAHRW